jgi:hypothetical protein
MMRKPVLDHGNTLTIHRVVTSAGTRRPKPGDRFTETSTWRYRNGEVAGRVGHTVAIHADDAGTLALEYTLNGQPVRQWFDLFGRPCRFGGYRWLARCPATGRPVAKLYGCTGTFQPRHRLVASYRSQDRMPATEKLRDREVAILRRLDADDSVRGDPPKPKWMRWPTYSRLALDLRATRGAYAAGMANDLRHLMRLAGEDLEEA